MRRALAALVVAAASLAACGGDTSPLSEAAEVELGQQVQQVRTDAAAGDAEAARGTLAELRAAVDELRRRGELSDAGATRILAAATDVEQALALITTTTAPTTTTSTARPPPPTTARGDDEDEDDEDEGRAGDRGRGKGKEDD